MKIFSAVLVLVVAASSFGAVVTGSVTVAPGTPTAALPVTLNASGPINAVDVIFQSAALDVSNFAFATNSPAWTSTTFNGNMGLTGAASENWVGAAITVASTYLAVPVTLGTLTIPTGALAVGTYTVAVDGAGDAISGVNTAAGFDAVNGTLTVNVVPEPATMALLALGGLLVARRRR